MTMRGFFQLKIKLSSLFIQIPDDEQFDTPPPIEKAISSTFQDILRWFSLIFRDKTK